MYAFNARFRNREFMGMTYPVALAGGGSVAAFLIAFMMFFSAKLPIPGTLALIAGVSLFALTIYLQRKVKNFRVNKVLFVGHIDSQRPSQEVVNG